MAGLTYREAGVDIDAGDELVRRIKQMTRSTHSPNVIGGVGGFAGLFALPGGLREPVLVSGTDGVGTKLKLAFMLQKHDTVGIDLVAMCVNDVLTCGATPLFFLDYFATGKLHVDEAQSVIAGITNGCLQAQCALLGGETAELPGFYQNGEYDLAGFAVGVVERSAILNGDKVRTGDVVIGFASTGLHSNGYSLARRALLPDGDEIATLSQQFGDSTLGESLLTPTRIYSAEARVCTRHDVHAMCHITGGGLPENLPRVLPDGTGIDLRGDAWPRPAIFDRIQQAGRVESIEMYRTFNMGIGYVGIFDASKADAVVAEAAREGLSSAYRIGVVTDKPGVRIA